MSFLGAAAQADSCALLLCLGLLLMVCSMPRRMNGS
jgi:hypothetical protein